MIPARNEQRYLTKTLQALQNQTIKPAQVIVVNDNSIDSTRNIALEFGCEVYDFPYKHENWITDFKLAAVKNLGFRFLKNDLDYIMILGADHLLPENYIERIIERMQKDPKLVIASGKIRNEWSVSPRGSGRIIKMFFWKKINCCYPLNWGYESYCLYKALQLGYKYEHFADILTDTQRTTAISYKPIMYYHYGKAMKALGYPKLYAIGRALVISKRKGIKSGIKLYQGYLNNHVKKYEPELQAHVKPTHQFTSYHIKRFLKYLFSKN